jgi:hypothetical protein
MVSEADRLARYRRDGWPDGGSVDRNARPQHGWAASPCRRTVTSHYLTSICAGRKSDSRKNCVPTPRSPSRPRSTLDPGKVPGSRSKSGRQ